MCVPDIFAGTSVTPPFFGHFERRSLAEKSGAHSYARHPEASEPRDLSFLPPLSRIFQGSGLQHSQGLPGQPAAVNADVPTRVTSLSQAFPGGFGFAIQRYALRLGFAEPGLASLH
jgi:hypothetical protein